MLHMFNFVELNNAQTRELMVQEIELANSSGNIYYSKRFNEVGNAQWVELLTEAAREHDEHWLASQIKSRGLMKARETSKTPSGGSTTKDVPDIAAETMAEGQFNRFYILGVLRRAMLEGKTHVSVYRAMKRSEHRPESDAMIGTRIPVGQLLKELRDVHTSLNHDLVKPNSGLSVRL